MRKHLKADCLGLHGQGERGNLLVELSLTLPLFIFMSFCGLEFANAMRQKQLVQVLSRVAARSALSCSATITHDQNNTNFDAQGCLQLVLNRIQPQIANVAPNSQLVLLLYSKNVTSTPAGPMVQEAWIGGNNGVEKSLTDPNKLLANAEALNMLNKQGVLVISEVSLQRQNLFNFFGIAQVYDATVL